MRLTLPRDRIEDRRLLLARFDGLRRELDAGGTLEAMDHFTAQAFDVILRGVAGAFDLSREDPKTVARYDTAPLVPAGSINPK